MYEAAVLQACILEVLGVAMKIKAQAPALDFVETVLHILEHVGDCFVVIHVKGTDHVARLGYVFRAAGSLHHRQLT